MYLTFEIFYQLHSSKTYIIYVMINNSTNIISLLCQIILFAVLIEKKKNCPKCLLARNNNYTFRR